jgi:ketosteroid isomerase-like protein
MRTKQIVQYRTTIMRRFSHALFLALLFSSMSLATATAAPTGAQGVDEAWRKAITANELNAIMTLYSKDAVMWLPDAPEAKGLEAIRKSYADLLAANTVTAATLANTHYEISGDLSVGWGDFTLVLAPKPGGNSVSLSGRFSVIARKEDGKWVYVVDHASAHPAPPTPH